MARLRRRPLISSKSACDIFLIAKSNSSSLMARSTSVFSRSRAARVRPPATTGAPAMDGDISGASVRYAPRPTKLAATMVSAEDMMLASDCPVATITTAVAPNMPHKRKNCQAGRP